MGVNSHFIIERNVPRARATWPVGRAGSRWLVISGRGQPDDGAAAADKRHNLNWCDSPPEMGTESPRIIVLFEAVDRQPGELLTKLDFEQLARFRVWLHYGGEVDLLRIAEKWATHKIHIALGAKCAKAVESEFGFPMPVCDRQNFSWKPSWERFKFDLSKGKGIERLCQDLDDVWAAAEERCRQLFRHD